MAASSPAPAENTLERTARRIALASVSVGIALSVAKVLVGLHAGSVSVVSDGLEGAGDALSSAIVFAGLSLASRPPDFEHPYGHGRYETLAALAVGGLLLLAGAAILWHGITSLSEPPSAVPFYALYPLFAALVLKTVLATTKLRVGRRLQSTSLQSDAWHDITDLLSTSIALIAVGLSVANPTRFAQADRVGGVAIGIIILFLALKVVHRTVGQLLDTMPEPAKLAEIREAALRVPGALGIEKCYARRTGLKYHVDLHLEVDPELTVRASHEIATRVRTAIREALPWVADVLVHVEPSPAVPRRPQAATYLRRRHGK